MADSNLLHLDPQLLKICRDWQMQCQAAFLPVRVTVTWRSSADQEHAKADGLSNAGAGESPHNCIDADGSPASRAFDFACFNNAGGYIEDGADPRYREAGEIGKRLGLEWGGDWLHPDWDHLELADWKTL